MRYVIELFIWLFIVFVNVDVNMCQVADVKTQREEETITSLGEGDAVDGYFEGIWGDKESRYFKLRIPENTDSKWMACWMANYADSPVKCSLFDDKGRILEKEIRIPTNCRKIIPVRTGEDSDKENPYRLLPGGTYYVKMEKQFFSARGRYIIAVFDMLDNNK